MSNSQQSIYDVSRCHNDIAASPVSLIGVPLRDDFAAKAMQAAITGHFSFYGHNEYWEPAAIAAYAYEVADAMVKAQKG